jgi:hypothetical protein
LRDEPCRQPDTLKPPRRCLRVLGGRRHRLSETPTTPERDGSRLRAINDTDAMVAAEGRVERAARRSARLTTSRQHATRLFPEVAGAHAGVPKPPLLQATPGPPSIQVSHGSQAEALARRSGNVDSETRPPASATQRDIGSPTRDAVAPQWHDNGVTPIERQVLLAIENQLRSIPREDLANHPATETLVGETGLPRSQVMAALGALRDADCIAGNPVTDLSEPDLRQIVLLPSGVRIAELLADEGAHDG